MELENIKVAIVDDETIFRVLTRKKLEEVMSKMPFSYELHEYNSGFAFLKEEMVYDIVFMDIAMPEMSGLETAEKYREYCPNGILIFLTLVHLLRIFRDHSCGGDYFIARKK